MSAKCDRIIEAAVAWVKEWNEQIDHEYTPSKAEAELLKTVSEANLAPGEPVFVLRGRDVAAPPAINGYKYEALRYGALPLHMESCDQRYSEFLRWQNANPERVKIPD